MNRHPKSIARKGPLFYYLLHLPLIHGLAVLASYLHYGQANWWFANPPEGPDTPNLRPSDYGYSLPIVYLVWLGVVLAFYPICRWFAEVKRRRRVPWLSYL